MKIANRITVARFTDHLVIRFGLQTDPGPDKASDLGELVEELVLPITTTAQFALDLFRAVVMSTLDLTAFFTALQASFNGLNQLSADIEKQKAAVAAAKAVPASKPGGE
jgi:hypothetical protein